MRSIVFGHDATNPPTSFHRDNSDASNFLLWALKTFGEPYSEPRKSKLNEICVWDSPGNTHTGNTLILNRYQR